MMPFGEWFDRYYQEIYVPAIKDAASSVRADELFTTGSVVEQIWEQIEKAKLLLADLSGKNPNVFYELGLAHAAGQPVIFAAAQVDDVPFDLRHLRVIIYDIREPEWAAKLRKSVTDYLEIPAKNPGKSIPHPFRKLAQDPASPPAKPSRRAFKSTNALQYDLRIKVAATLPAIPTRRQRLSQSAIRWHGRVTRRLEMTAVAPLFDVGNRLCKESRI